MSDREFSKESMTEKVAGRDVTKEYFRRLRWYYFGVVLSTASIVLGAFLVVSSNLQPITRIVLLVIVAAASAGLQIYVERIFRCPICNYKFRTYYYHNEASWRHCPKCGTRFYKGERGPS